MPKRKPKWKYRRTSKVLKKAKILIWNIADSFLIRLLGINFIEIWIKIQQFSFEQISFKMQSETGAMWFRPQCLRRRIYVNMSCDGLTDQYIYTNH